MKNQKSVLYIFVEPLCEVKPRLFVQHMQQECGSKLFRWLNHSKANKQKWETIHYGGKMKKSNEKLQSRQ